MQTGAARHRELASKVNQLQADLDTWQHDGTEEQLDDVGQGLDSVQAKVIDAGLASAADTVEEIM